MEFEVMGSSPYIDYLDTHIGQVFEYRDNRKAYLFRFTENTMVVEVYRTLDLVYLPKYDMLFENIQYGEAEDLFYYRGSTSYFDTESSKFLSTSLIINGISFNLIIEDLNINIEGEIYDVKSLSHLELYYYVDCDNGYSYRIYFYNGYIREVKEYAPSE